MIGLRQLLCHGMVVVMCCVAITEVSAQSPELDNHAFRLILNQSGLKPLRRVDDLSKSPEQTILIVFGHTKVIHEIPNGLRSFVEVGGAVLIATDRQVPSFFQRSEMLLGIADRGIRARRGTRSYGDRLHCPIVYPEPGLDAPLFETTHPIATNRPSYVAMSISASELKSGPLSVFAWLKNCTIQGATGSLPVKEPLPFAVGGTMGKGRLLVVADHSIFINGMMLPSDLENGNMQCAYNCVHWLKEGTRTRALFVDEGSIESSFDVPLQSLPDLPVSPIQLVNAVIAAAEKENLFNRYVLEALGERRVLRLWLIGLTAALLIYGVFRLMRAGYQFEPKVPFVKRSMVQLQSDGSVAEQRHQQVLSDGNFWEAGRNLAIDTLVELGYDSARTAPREPPRLRIGGNWWHRQTLSRRVRRLWELAYGERPRSVSQRQFAEILIHAEEVRGAARQGILTIET